MERVQIWITEEADLALQSFKCDHQGSKKIKTASEAILAGLPKLRQAEQAKKQVLTNGYQYDCGG